MIWGKGVLRETRGHLTPTVGNCHASESKRGNPLILEGNAPPACFSLKKFTFQKAQPMKNTRRVLPASILAGLLVLTTAIPALATTRGAGEPITASGNVISWSGGAVAYEATQEIQPDGNELNICDLGTANCFFGGTGFLASVPLQAGATSLTVTSTLRKMDGSQLGEGTFTAQMTLHTRDGDGNSTAARVGAGVTIVVPAYVPPSNSGGSPSASASSPEPVGPPAPAVGMALQASVGSTVEGTPVSFTGVAMKTGSTYVLQVNSEPVILATGTIAEGGRISGLPRLPALPPGTHTLRLTTTGSDGSSLTISQVFVVGEDGRFVSISDPAGSVDPAAGGDRDRLAYTGMEPSVLPWWALMLLLLGLLLLAYSIRATRLMNRPDLAQAIRDARTPWEILATPIAVPGIDYSPTADTRENPPVVLGAAIRELDLAISTLIAHQIERFGMPATQR